MNVRIVSTGFYAPPRIETAAELAPRLGKSADWIIQHTGVARRRIAEEPMEMMAAAAARQAIGDGPPPDLVINASLTPRQLIPDSSVFIQRELGLEGTPSFSIHATCLSFLVALHNASALISVGAYKRILIVSAEVGSLSRNFDEPESAALIGDGAAAVILESAGDTDSALVAYEMGTWPSGAELTELRGGGIRCHPNLPGWTREDNLFHMNGPGVYKMARRRVALVLARVLEKAGMTRDDIDLVVPHQASGPALSAIARYGFTEERVVNIIADYGNCIAASTPMALHAAASTGRLHRGDRILLLGTGAGLSVGAVVLRW
ncbi:MAG: 3-oxoacyl-[acyl-carrier-protein] synthase-3 [Myxococcota bacterium]|jgi:3-oxoacyl-[acyl-carrier-protein] synthase-3